MATNRVLPFLALVLLATAAWSREATPAANCLTVGSAPPISDAKLALAANASDLNARFKLADAWSDAGCFTDALAVLEAGQALNPRSTELDARIRVARSVLSEQTYFDKLDQAQQEAKLSRAIFRCTKLADLSSCDEALGMKPNDPQLLVAQADILMQQKRSGDAIVAYRRLPPNAPNHDAIGAKLASAETLRRSQLESCENKEGEPAAHACELAWLSGAPDEFNVLKRRGVLLQAMNQPSAALDAYLGAARVKPDDAQVAAAIVSLSAHTDRMPPATLAARGEALVTLGRAPEAIAPLTQALKLQPSLTKAKKDLLIAQNAARHHASPKVTVKEEHAVKDDRAAVASNANSHYSNDAPATRSN